ncbi:MAG TPA: cysteine desulfurase family protein [Thermoanaerobaculia bacterium]|nr:cysteine desulfurase family protein [Thermoanaerobaculia bacterium]
MKRIIDLDANATTRMLPEVINAVCGAMRAGHGNSSSSHGLGKAAGRAVGEARGAVAELIGADVDEVIFVPSATAAINLAVLGHLGAARKRDRRLSVFLSRLEHMAVLKAVQAANRKGLARVTVLPSGEHGEARPLDAHIPDHIDLVCVFHGNNEIGTLNDLVALSNFAKAAGARLFVDAAQTGAYCPVRVDQLPVDLACISAHKMHGPLGAAALYVRRDTPMQPILFGGGQEKGLWPGTLNVPALVGFGVAARLARTFGAARVAQVERLRELLWNELLREVPDAILNGHPTNRLPGNLSITIPFVPVEVLQRRLPGLAFSRGSACASDSGGPSHVLSGLGLGPEEARWTIRLGVSTLTREQDVIQAGRQIGRCAKAIRGW